MKDLSCRDPFLCQVALMLKIKRHLNNKRRLQGKLKRQELLRKKQNASERKQRKLLRKRQGELPRKRPKKLQKRRPDELLKSKLRELPKRKLEEQPKKKPEELPKRRLEELLRRKLEKLLKKKPDESLRSTNACWLKKRLAEKLMNQKSKSVGKRRKPGAKLYKKNSKLLKPPNKNALGLLQLLKQLRRSKRNFRGKLKKLLLRQLDWWKKNSCSINLMFHN